MKFVDKPPSTRAKVRSIYDAWLPASDLASLRRHPGRWALIREGVPKNHAYSFVQYLRRQGLTPTYRVTTPGGTQCDIYAKYDKKETQS